MTGKHQYKKKGFWDSRGFEPAITRQNDGKKNNKKKTKIWIHGDSNPRPPERTVAR